MNIEQNKKRNKNKTICNGRKSVKAHVVNLGSIGRWGALAIQVVSNGRAESGCTIGTPIGWCMFS